MSRRISASTAVRVTYDRSIKIQICLSIFNADTVRGLKRLEYLILSKIMNFCILPDRSSTAVCTTHIFHIELRLNFVDQYSFIHPFFFVPFLSKVNNFEI